MKLLSKGDPSSSQLLFYQTQDGKTRLELRLDRETVWLTLNQNEHDDHFGDITEMVKLLII